MTAQSTPSALVGRDGWLFLSDDANGSVRIFRGMIALDQAQSAGWDRYFIDLDQIATKIGADYVFSVAPSKESILPEFYPFEPAPERLIDQFANRYPQAFYPVDVLRRHSRTSYDKVDTHWNEWGAYLANSAALERIGVSLLEHDLADFERRQHPTADLGRKMTPPVAGSTLEYPVDIGRHRIFDNRIHNHGRVWVYRNEDAPNDLNCLLLGDSFGTSAVKFYAESFTRFAYVHTTALDEALMRKFRPDLIVVEVTERFLARAPRPSEGFDLSDTVREKIRQLAPAQRAGTAALQLKVWPELSRAFEMSSQDGAPG